MAEFLLGEAVDEGFCYGGIGDQDGLEFRAEGGFDGACCGVVCLDEGGEDAFDGGFEFGRGVEAFEEVLGAFCEAFAGCDELLDGLEAGGALGEDFVGFGGGFACGIEIAAGVVVGAFGGLEGFFEFAEFVSGFGNEGEDLGLLGDVFFVAEVEALFFIGELAGAVAVAFELGEGGLDFRLHGGDECLGFVGLGAGGAEGGFEVGAGFAGGEGLLFLFLKLQLLLGDAAGELVEGFVCSCEVEFLLGEFFAGGCDVGMVLRDAAFEFGFAFVVERRCVRGRRRGRFGGR